MSGDRRHFTTAEEFEEFKAKVHAEHTFEFGGFHLNTVLRECTIDGGDIHIPPQTFETLAILVRACPDPVSVACLSKQLGVGPNDVKAKIRNVRNAIGGGHVATLGGGYGYLFVPFPEGAPNDDMAEHRANA